MQQHKTAQILAMQNLINAYCFELQCGEMLMPHEQTSTQKQLAKGCPILQLRLAPLDLTMMIPVWQISRLGQHRFADIPWIMMTHHHQKLSVTCCAQLLLEDIAHRDEQKDTFKNQLPSGQSELDVSGVLKRWIQSYQGLQVILEHRSDEIDDVVKQQLNFIETEQNLIYGHAMHPTPKGREGFHPDDWANYAPETQSQFQLTYWLVDPDCIAEDYVDGDSISDTLMAHLKPSMTTLQTQLVNQHPTFKLLPLHPWQARFLASKPWYARLYEQGKLHHLGALGWDMYPTTSVRTLASFAAPWMFKTSLSVAITNSVRINLHKECKRGIYACKIWRSDYGNQLIRQYPSVSVLNDPAWVALKIEGKVVDETICIFRDNPFNEQTQVTNLASLCQDHPMRCTNRLATLFQSIAKRRCAPNSVTATNATANDANNGDTDAMLADIAIDWFARYLHVGFVPLIDLYYEQGLGFEVHQQNSLIELQDDYPVRFWARDNQGFGYIAEYAMTLIDKMPDLVHEAECVVPEDFADERYAYYLVGNTIFALITAIARTGYVTEVQLLTQFKSCLSELERRYPNRSLLNLLLHQPTLPFKANLMTRLCALDELRAPVERQSVYVNITNPLYQSI